MNFPFCTLLNALGFPYRFEHAVLISHFYLSHIRFTSATSTILHAAENSHGPSAKPAKCQQYAGILLFQVKKLKIYSEAPG
jgi:hypothetical protein